MWKAQKIQSKIGTIYVEADRWFDAQRYAMRHFGCDTSEVQLVEVEKPGDTGPVYRLKWQGSDFNHPPSREMIVETLRR